jgi:MSHA biogenesis protein MshQ
MFINTNGSIQFVSASAQNVGVTQSGAFSGAGAIQPDRWYFFTAVIDADANFIGLYIDGTLIASGFYDSSGIRDTTGPLRFSDPDHPVQGRIDDYSLWHKALSRDEILAIMHTSLTGNEAGLYGYWRLDEAGGNKFTDSSPYHNDGYLSGVLPGQPGALGDDPNTAAQIDGGQIALTIPQLNTASGTTNTVSFWMNWDGTDLVMPIGFAGYDLFLWNGNFGFNTGQSDIWGTSSVGLADGWVHVVAVFQNGNATLSKLYIDGVEQTLTQRAGTTNTNRSITTAARLSGWTNDTGYHFRGALDEVAFFNRTLSAAEVQAQFNARNSGYAATVSGQAPVAYYRLGGTDAGFLADSTPNGNNGTDVLAAPNPPATWVAHDGDYALQFDGIDDSVNVGNRASLTMVGKSQMTIEASVYPTATQWETFAGKENEYLIGRSSSGTLIWAFNAANPGWTWHDTGYLLPLNAWSQVAVVFDAGFVNGSGLGNGRVQAYVNGNLVDTFTPTNATAIGNITGGGDAFRIGSRPWGEFFAGRVDEVRVWDTARTRAQIVANGPFTGAEAGL